MDETRSEAFLDQLEVILDQEKPDLVLTGRDEDAYLLCDLIRDTSSDAILTHGSKDSLKMALNKYSTWLFAKRYDLPFAETFVLGASGDIKALDGFIASVGFPIIAKPVEGYASKGVFFLRNRNEVHYYAQKAGYMLQAYLGDPSGLTAYFDLIDGPTPLFAHAPDVYLYSCHFIIGPDGSISPIFLSKNSHHSGKTIIFKRIHNDKLMALALRYAQAIVEEGGAGPVSIQVLPDRWGTLKVQEIDMRCTGNTYPRLMLGYDELGMMINSFLPEVEFPMLPEMPDIDDKDVIVKTLYCNRLSKS